LQIFKSVALFKTGNICPPLPYILILLGFIADVETPKSLKKLASILKTPVVSIENLYQSPFASTELLTCANDTDIKKTLKNKV
jgi:hypothetical protein